MIEPGCGCTICLRIAAFELGLSAPYTPSDWRLIEQRADVIDFTGPPVIEIDVDRDPTVVSAASALATAEATYNTADDRWRDSIAELREYELLTNSIDAEIATKARGE